ncbi:MAG: hypothetical protein QG622_758 [Actinomycetota bacterium]|nr:hypothetical protein [Actinomycetota bacterium]
MTPRYQCLVTQGAWTWRLLCSNHRELARALVRFPTQELAAADARSTGQLARAAAIDILLEADTSWRWVMEVDGEPRVGSVVRYARRPECLRAITRFRDSAPVAVVMATPLIRRARSGRSLRATAEAPDGSPPGPRSDLYRDLRLDVRGRAGRGPG